MAMTQTVLGLRHCPRCGGENLIPVTAGGAINYFCQDCVLCWHLEHGWTNVIDPQSCPGCRLESAACFERWGIRPGSDHDDLGWGDIEAELYGSTREACVSSFHFGE
jgi:hypothetical protein